MEVSTQGVFFWYSKGCKFKALPLERLPLKPRRNKCRQWAQRLRRCTSPATANDSFSVNTMAFDKSVINSCKGWLTTRYYTLSVLCRKVLQQQQSSSASIIQSIHSFSSKEAGIKSWFMTYMERTLRGDSPPTYTKSTSCRFIMCSNICLLGSALTAGLEREIKPTQIIHLNE